MEKDRWDHMRIRSVGLHENSSAGLYEDRRSDLNFEFERIVVPEELTICFLPFSLINLEYLVIW